LTSAPQIDRAFATLFSEHSPCQTQDAGYCALRSTYKYSDAVELPLICSPARARALATAKIWALMKEQLTSFERLGKLL
jgi:hypothetical protein